MMMSEAIAKRPRRLPVTIGAAVCFLALVTLCCILGRVWWPVAPEAQALEMGATPPSWSHPLGTDLLGRDLLARLLAGGRLSLLVGLLGTTVSVLLGTAVGLIAGYVGGRLDAFLMRLVEVLYSLPFTVLVILLMAAWGQHFALLFVALGLVCWLPMARVVRGQTLSLRQRQFVEAALASGAGHRRILGRHLLPNLSGLILVYATLTVPQVLLLEAFLSFLGLGVQAPQTSWGLLIHDGAASMEAYPWLLIFPSVLFAVTLLALNFLGDGLRDLFDPRSASTGR